MSQDNKPAEGAPPPPAQPMSAMDQAIQGLLGPAVAIFMQGVMAVLGAGFPIDKLMITLAKILGRAFGNGIIGELGPVLKLRAECKKAFEAGVNEMPVMVAPAQQQPPAGQGHNGSKLRQ